MPGPGSFAPRSNQRVRGPMVALRCPPHSSLVHQCSTNVSSLLASGAPHGRGLPGAREGVMPALSLPGFMDSHDRTNLREERSVEKVRRARARPEFHAGFHGGSGGALPGRRPVAHSVRHTRAVSAGVWLPQDAGHSAGRCCRPNFESARNLSRVPLNDLHATPVSASHARGARSRASDSPLGGSWP